MTKTSFTSSNVLVIVTCTVWHTEGCREYQFQTVNNCNEKQTRQWMIPPAAFSASCAHAYKLRLNPQPLSYQALNSTLVQPTQYMISQNPVIFTQKLASGNFYNTIPFPFNHSNENTRAVDWST